MKDNTSRSYSALPLFLLLFSFILSSCGSEPNNNFSTSDDYLKIEPDYSDITIPPNIAPLNFKIKENGEAFFVRFYSESGIEFEVKSGNGKVIIPANKWRKMLQNNTGKKYFADIYSKDANGKWLKYKTITNRIASEPADPFLYYRLLYPGYESWAELSINFRNIENFETETFIENRVAEENCINCHSFNNGKSDNFMFHIRGSLGGTYIFSNGEYTKHNLKTAEMENGAVYPRWHPSGKFVVFSSNKIIQRFHAADNKKVEVSDLESSLVLYDLEKNEMMDINLSGKDVSMDTYPEWSPNGEYLYFCRAPQISAEYDYKSIRYNLYRASFNISDRTVGDPELIYDASAEGNSISFPRISPDGRFLIVTCFDYGTFPIWHKEADLWSVDLENFKASPLGLNSDFSDSYHSWSSNGKWLVFSSKRGDGLTARPYFAYIHDDGTSEKPFILPQKDPEYYKKLLKSFNIPEFSSVKRELNPGEIRDLTESEATPAKWKKK